MKKLGGIKRGLSPVRSRLDPHVIAQTNSPDLPRRRRGNPLLNSKTLALKQMAELDLRKSPWNEGIGISGEFLDHQLYLLGCMVHASAAFDKLGNHPLCNLRQQFQETEIGRLLLTIAVAVRNAMDQNLSRADYWLQDTEDGVGILKNLVSQKDVETTLSFREACNKLVHCLSINFHYAAEKPQKGMALVPRVHLYGTKGKEKWKATIEIDRFIEVASHLT